VVYNGAGIPIYQCPDKEIPSRVEHPLPSILSLLLSVTKTKGKAEKTFPVAVTLTAWPQPRVILSALKPKYLQCLQLGKVSSSKRAHWRKGSRRDMRAQRAGGCQVSLGLSVSSGEDQGEKGCFGEHNLLGTLGRDAGCGRRPKWCVLQPQCKCIPCGNPEG
jgi:hypothetical protein